MGFIVALGFGALLRGVSGYCLSVTGVARDSLKSLESFIPSIKKKGLPLH